LQRSSHSYEIGPGLTQDPSDPRSWPGFKSQKLRLAISLVKLWWLVGSTQNLTFFIFFIFLINHKNMKLIYEYLVLYIFFIYNLHLHGLFLNFFKCDIILHFTLFFIAYTHMDCFLTFICVILYNTSFFL
jgi:hypothetical protein